MFLYYLFVIVSSIFIDITDERFTLRQVSTCSDVRFTPKEDQSTTESREKETASVAVKSFNKKNCKLDLIREL